MKRDELRKSGLTDEQIDCVMNQHGEDMNAQKAMLSQKDEQIATLTTERDGLKTQVADRDKDISELKKTAGDNEALTQKLTDLQARYDTETTGLKKSLDEQARNFAVEGLFNGVEFTSALAKKAAIAEFKASNPEFREGRFSDADVIMKKLREQYPEAFKTDDKKKPDETKPEDKKLPNFTQPLTGKIDSGEKNPFSFAFTSVRNTDAAK
ncbi:MAG: phage scaffolding protein [Clostridia bacterium]